MPDENFETFWIYGCDQHSKHTAARQSQFEWKITHETNTKLMMDASTLQLINTIDRPTFNTYANEVHNTLWRTSIRIHQLEQEYRKVKTFWQEIDWLCQRCRAAEEARSIGNLCGWVVGRVFFSRDARDRV